MSRVELRGFVLVVLGLKVFRGVVGCGVGKSFSFIVKGWCILE